MFENFKIQSNNEFDTNPLYCVSLPGDTWLRGLKNTEIKLQNFRGKDKVLLLQKIIRGRNSSVMGDGHVKSDDHKKMLYVDANSL